LRTGASPSFRSSEACETAGACAEATRKRLPTSSRPTERQVGILACSTGPRTAACPSVRIVNDAAAPTAFAGP
jgi:hypothetical protein